MCLYIYLNVYVYLYMHVHLCIYYVFICYLYVHVYTYIYIHTQRRTIVSLSSWKAVVIISNSLKRVVTFLAPKKKQATTRLLLSLFSDYLER